MKLQAEIGGDDHSVEIRVQDGKLFAQVDDREYELEFSEPEPGVYLFKHNGMIYQATVSRAGDKAGSIRLHIGANEVDVRVIDPKKLRGAGAGNNHTDGVVDITTAMPGKVVRLLVEPGAAVKQGDGIVVVEAMKMQNELKSPKAGIVKEIRASAGATVSAGDVLATIE